MTAMETIAPALCARAQGRTFAVYPVSISDTIGNKHMRGMMYRLLSASMLSLALCGCGTLEHRSGHIAPGVKLASTSAHASMEAPPDPTPAYRQNSLDLNIFGLSYHPDREGTRVSHLDNEINTGLGANYELHNDARGVTSVEAGFFRDSGRNWASLTGASYQLKFGDHWKLGAALLALHSRTYNNGGSFIAPIPRITYDFGAIKLSAAYIPKVSGINDFAVFAIYFSVPLRK